ncbi:MAG: thioredoxin family protein [Holosporaceae bacterium]|jgi:suppressor for copper-sensitivity B|nr:thioredoxin family protein [Holosporaceae bacterium]
MGNLIKAFVLAIPISLFFFDATSISPEDLKTSVRCIPLNAETFRCEFTISAPSGFKFAKAPEISVAKSENLKNFKYDGDFRLPEVNVCNAVFFFARENPKIRPVRAELTISCFLCSDVCTVVSKSLVVVPDVGQSPSESLPTMLLLAFLGGLILNVMPCVLPVLLMKLKSLRSREAIVGSIAGNYAAFAAFAVFTAFLKATGETAGWGMHFGNPYFLVVVTLALFVLTLYGFGLIPLFPSLETDDRKRGVFFENFFSAVAAVVVAAPCTAPGLGVAAAFAIGGSLPELFAVFFAIATGFCVPWIASLAVSPSFFLKLGCASRSGVVEKIVNGGVLCAFLWMFWLLSRRLSPAAVALCVAFFAIATLLSAKKKFKIAATATILFFLCFPYREFASRDDSPRGLPLQLSPREIGKKVIVFNVTADWCLTCRYNKRVFRDEKVGETMRACNAEFLEVELTPGDDALMRFISARGRAGIPFTAVFGPGAPDGILLSEIPTAEEAVKALNAAAGRGN